MKLIFFIDNARQIGGGEYAQFKFAEAMAKKGHDVTIFSGDKTFLSDELTKQKNLVVYNKKTIPQYVKKMGIGKANAAIDKTYTKTVIEPFIKKIVENKKPNEDIWLIGYLTRSAIKAQKLGKKFNLQVANFIFESPPWFKEQLGEEEWEKEWKSTGFRKAWEQTGQAYANSTVLIPNSNLSGKKCKEWLPKSNVSEPVYPGIELSKQSKKRTGKTQKIQRNIDITYLGRLNKLKNIDEFLYAISPKEKVVIIGQGEERTVLENIVKDKKLNVEFKGAVSEKEKWKILQKSKILIFPTSFEGFGMPPMEGLMSGCQSLCSDIPILKEVYGTTVHYFKLHSINDMRKKIIGILKKEIPHKKIPKKFINQYSWENSAKTIEKILKKNKKVLK